MKTPTQISEIGDNIRATNQATSTEWGRFAWITLIIAVIVGIGVTASVFWAVLKWWIGIAAIAAGFVALWSVPFVIVRLVTAEL